MSSLGQKLSPAIGSDAWIEYKFRTLGTDKGSGTGPPRKGLRGLEARRDRPVVVPPPLANESKRVEGSSTDYLPKTDIDSLLRDGKRSALRGTYGGGYGLPVHPGLIRRAESRSAIPSRDAGARKGTYFLGGAGLDGGYIEDMVRALSNAGVSNVSAPDRSLLSKGMPGDLALVPYYDDDREYDISRLDVSDSGPQFNLVGYSYGSLLAAQIADTYARQGGKVDNLVLVSSPIGKSYLETLQKNQNIKKVITINLAEQGDPLYAGMPKTEAALAVPRLLYQMPQSTGHFYYAPDSKEGRERRAKLAQRLYNEGLR